MTTNVAAGVKVKIIQGTNGTLAMSAASGTPVCTVSLDIEEEVTNGGKVKIVGCTVGDARVKLLNGATELASYSVMISPADTASLSPMPSTFTIGDAATEFTLTTNVATGLKVKIAQGTGTLTMSDSIGKPVCTDSLDIEEDVTNGDKVKIIGCTEGAATVKLFNGATELANYTVTVLPAYAASLSPEPMKFTLGADATEFTLTTNVSDGIQVQVAQGTGAMAMSASSGTPVCTDSLDIEEDVANGERVKIIGCTEGTATVKLLKGTVELASYAVTISPADMASLSPVPSTFTVGAAATEFILTTNVAAGVKVKITQVTDTLSLAAAGGTPLCGGVPDTEEVVNSGGDVSIIGCFQGSAIVSLLKDSTVLASYSVTISLPDTARLSPEPSTFTVGNSATEFTLTTNVSAGIKVQVTQGTGTMAMSTASGTPSCVNPLDIEEDLIDGGKVKIVGCTVGAATVKLLNGATELASYSVMISPADTASLSPAPSTFTVGASATEFTLTTNVATGVKVKIAQGTGTVTMSDANSTPSCDIALDIEEDLNDGDKVKLIGCTAGDATVKLLNGATELASYSVTASPADTASLFPEPMKFTLGAGATEFTLTTNVAEGVKVKITQGTGTVTMSDANGTLSCDIALDIEEDLNDGDKVKIVGCTVGDATVKLLNGASKLASYSVTISPADTASLSPVPLTFTVGAAATEFILTTNVAAGVKVKITQVTDTLSLAAAGGTPLCGGVPDTEEVVNSGGDVSIIGCLQGNAIVQLLKGTTELASYAVTISPPDSSSLSPEPSAFTVDRPATELTLTTNVVTGVKVQITQGTGSMAMSAASGMPSCIGPLDVEEDVLNGGKVKMVGCSEGSATVKLRKDNIELASYPVVIWPADMASLSPIPSAFTVGAAATEFILTTNVAAGVKVKITQGTGTETMSDANGTPSCESPLNIEEDVTNGGKVKMVGCSEGSAIVKLLNGATELASYAVTILLAETASLSLEPSAFTVDRPATEFTLTTNVVTGVKVQITQGSGSVALSDANGAPECIGPLDVEENLNDGDKVRIVGCAVGDATVTLLNGATELASYAVTVLPVYTASLSPEPSEFTVDSPAMEFTLTTNVVTGVKVEITQGTGTLSLAAAGSTPLCSGFVDVEEDLVNGGKVKVIGCTEGSATIKLLKDATELASYLVTIFPLEAARLSPIPATFTVGADATEFVLTTVESAGLKVRVIQGTGTVALSDANGTPSCAGTLDVEEDVLNGGKVKIVGCTEGTATVQLLNGITVVASYIVTVSTPITASLPIPVRHSMTIGDVEGFELTTSADNVWVGVNYSGNNHLGMGGDCPADIGGRMDNDGAVFGNGDTVSIKACAVGIGEVRIYEETTELATYTVAVTSSGLTSLSMPARHSMPMGAVESFNLITNSDYVWVGVNYDGNNHLGVGGDCPADNGGRETNDGAVYRNGDTVSIRACSVGIGQVRMYQGTAHLASYAVTVSSSGTASLSPEPSVFRVGNAATEFSLTTNIATGAKVKVTQGTGTVALSAASATPSCSGTLDVEEDINNGGKIKIAGCTQGSATVKLLNGMVELSSYDVTVPESAGLLPTPGSLSVGESISLRVATSVSDVPGVWVGVNYPYDTGSLAIDGGLQGSDCDSTGDNNGIVRTNGQSVTIRGCSAGASTIRIYKYQQVLASYSISVTEEGTAPVTMNMAHLAPESLKVGQFHFFTLETGIADPQGLWVGVNYGGTGNLVIMDSSCMGAEDSGAYFSNGDTVVIIACRAGTGDIRISHGENILANYTVTITGAS